MTDAVDVVVRPGVEADLPRVHELIVELAVYEKEPDAVVTTVEDMRRDGFGPDPIFEFLVATVDDVIVGLSLYYPRYSTWRGRGLYLEDLIVTERLRGRGIGKALFEATIRRARETGCTGMYWQVLDWNQPAIDFYRERYGAKIDTPWLNASLSRDQLSAAAAD